MKITDKDLCPCGSGLRLKYCGQNEEMTEQMTSPDELLAARFHALETGNYEQLYATYHPESPFLLQFSDRSTYIRFAKNQLSGIRVMDWKALGSRKLDAQRIEQILMMEIEVGGGSQYLFELALLVKTGTGWRYHSAQKLSGEDYSGPSERIDFHHFDNAVLKIRY